MQQRIVIRVLDYTKRKQLSKALQIAVSVSGIEAVALQGENKDHIEIVGEGIDAVNLTCLLRKKLGSVELISVIPIAEPEISEEEYTYGTTTTQPTVHPTYPVWTWPAYQPSLPPCPTYPVWTWPACQPSLPPYYVDHVEMSNQDS